MLTCLLKLSKSELKYLNIRKVFLMVGQDKIHHHNRLKLIYQKISITFIRDITWDLVWVIGTNCNHIPVKG